jgi:hypothetical protein
MDPREKKSRAGISIGAYFKSNVLFSRGFFAKARQNDRLS